MFLEIVKKRNEDLLKTAISFHQDGKILPDTYILDLDAILENGKKLIEESRNNGIKLYAMTKQIGRIPLIAKKLLEIGFDGIVTVDFKETEIMMKNGIKLGNVGHLVQIPSSMVEKVVEYNPEIITVYSIEKIIEIDKIAKKIGKIQSIMLRVLEKNSKIYSGQEGGFYIEDLENLILSTKELKNIKIEGITSFPCFLYNSEKNIVEKTSNVDSINKAKKILNTLGINITQVNMPSVTSLENINLIKENKGTHGEPGHSLTGTTPYNAKNLNGEIPGIVYVSEISHNFGTSSLCYGGGYYRRSGLENALVGDKYENMKEVKIKSPSIESIDYYLEIDSNQRIGNTVLMSFRTQIFVTRSDVAVVEGISKGEPKIIGIYDSLGREKI